MITQFIQAGGFIINYSSLVITTPMWNIMVKGKSRSTRRIMRSQKLSQHTIFYLETGAQRSEPFVTQSNLRNTGMQMTFSNKEKETSILEYHLQISSKFSKRASLESVVRHS